MFFLQNVIKSIPRWRNHFCSRQSKTLPPCKEAKLPLVQALSGCKVIKYDSNIAIYKTLASSSLMMVFTDYEDLGSSSPGMVTFQGRSGAQGGRWEVVYLEQCLVRSGVYLGAFNPALLVQCELRNPPGNYQESWKFPGTLKISRGPGFFQALEISREPGIFQVCACIL